MDQYCENAFSSHTKNKLHVLTMAYHNLQLHFHTHTLSHKRTTVGKDRIRGAEAGGMDGWKAVMFIFVRRTTHSTQQLKTPI